MTDLTRTLALDETRIGYHFVGATLRDGRPIPPDGEWLEHDGKVVMCISGLHASRHPFDTLQFAPGSTLCLVECEDIVTEHDDKLVCRRRRIVARIDATDLLWRAAREYAQAVLHLWDAPQVVKDFLASGDESLSAAACAAAWDAASAAASAAARAAARAAASAAAWAAASAAASAAARAAARAAASAAAWGAARAAARGAARGAALAAARGAALAAARAAAWDAAWEAALAAALDAQRTIFQRLVDEAFCHVANTEAA